MKTVSDTCKRASIQTLGCRLNQAESTLIGDRLIAAGYSLVPFGDTAEVGIIHTCTVTNEADVKCRKAIRSFIKKNPGSFTAVVGCYAQLHAPALAEIEGIDLILGNQNKLQLLNYIGQGKRNPPCVITDPIADRDFEIEVCGDTPLTQRANLKIQDGCGAMCAYCCSPFARGRPRSRTLHNLLDDATNLVSRGVKEIVLTGLNLGAYEYHGRTLMDVIGALIRINHLSRIRISSIELTMLPENLLNSMLDAMNDPGHPLMPHLHVPLQSGSNTVLDRMRRNHTAEDFVEFVHRAHQQAPGIGIGTDLLVGFPGETESEFMETCEVLSNIPLAYAHVFKYSERPGTPAAALPDKVSAVTKKSRSEHLRRIGAEKTKQYHERHLGTCADVLFEEQKNGIWMGYTGNYIRVGMQAEESLVNEIRTVKLKQDKGDWIVGTFNGK